MTEKENIIKSLKPMFIKARKEGLIIRSFYQGIIFTPDELEAKQLDGSYVWGRTNWELITPQSEYDRLKELADNHLKNAENFKKKHNL